MTRAGPVANAPAKRPPDGVGLIEVLVALLLLSIGFLAVARMQVQSMRIGQDAYHRSQAYFLAADMIDRMRSNVRGVLDGDYDALDTAADAPDRGCAAKSCTPAEMAEQDRRDWSAHLHAFGGEASFVPALPSSRSVDALGTVRPVAGEPGLYTVALAWAEREGGDTVERTLAMNFAVEISQ